LESASAESYLPTELSIGVLDLSFLTYRNIILWSGFWNVIGFLVMGYDKHLATSQEGTRRRNRISERTLHEISLVGGFLGIIIGASVFRHKTRKLSFWPPVAASLILWGVVLYLLFENGLLQIGALF
jgi:uncharacterized membrane protein YsdA (DUF1294 family)